MVTKWHEAKIIGVEAGYSGKYQVRYTYTFDGVLLMVTVGDKIQGLNMARYGFFMCIGLLKAGLVNSHGN